MKSVTQHFKKVMKLHADCARYYQLCAEITTEADLKELFTALAAQRRKMLGALSEVLPFNMERETWLLKDVLPYLQQAWYHMKLALILNNRQQILHHSLRSEQAMLTSYEQVATERELPEELFRLGIHHQQMLKENMRHISSAPKTKFSRQQSGGLLAREQVA